ncbi:MAG TPA: bifunctional 3-phosphoshikimate 1-carboxyvinyltransferase/cytidylate kinase [Burkholderiaceae bacterium]|jgi:3-phosphoshikimate 1-carboxyvinyltransferase|nr:bifunctional 3-phosphoshikimate 1-carboxyvinyltransferase/cytidylate kinase [Burkholderiaceae bacterium]
MYAIPFLDIPPLRSAGGHVRLPGSKSISNRVLLLAGLAEGSTLVHDLLDSDDTRVMLTALQALGCALQSEGASLRVTGIGGRLQTRSGRLFLGNAGTAMRPLTAALAVLATLQGGAFELSGVPRMHERPIGDLVDALVQLGCSVRYLGETGYPPLAVGAGEPRAELATQAPIRVRGDVSSQFLTALLLALPLATQERAVTIEVDGELISKPYVDITLNLLARFGIEVERDPAAPYARFTLPQGSRYRSPGAIRIEADASSASYFIALGAIAAVDEPLRIEGVGLDSIQGDIRFVDAARAMGADVTGGPGWLEIRRGRWPLAGLSLDANAIPDAAMTLAVLALYADAPVRITHIASWRVKETDRIAAMAAELRRCGADVIEGADFIEVGRPTAASWRAPAIHTYDDHRMAMCLALAAFNPLAGAEPPRPVRILDPRCVGKTFPDYFETLFSLARTEATDIPVITVDGPTASGKGTLASAIAARLGYVQLDSGALYRATALAVLDAGVDPADEPAVAALAAALEIRFEGPRAFLRDVDVTEALRAEATGNLASKVSVFAAVRTALHGLQLSFRRLPGLVADGRDMGTVLFPDATLKVFLTASVEARAERRHAQLISRGISANIDSLSSDLRERDARDMNRTVAPLRPAEDAFLLDNSSLGVEASVDAVLGKLEIAREARNP